jgi:hypothetical protein
MEKARHCRAFNFDLICNFAVMSFNDKSQNETARQLIDRLSAEYSVATVDPETGEILDETVEPEQQTETPQESVAAAPEPEPEKPIELEKKRQPRVVDNSCITYRSMLEHSIQSISLAMDEEL